ncbi:MAG: aminotransferase class III-fold pyridoxal phosphate-dependent enzyme [Pseudomonadota bacterium]
MSPANWPFTGGDMPQVVRAHGNTLTLADGREVLDAAGGAIVNNIGWGRESVARCLYETTRDLSYAVPPWITPGRAALVEALQTDWLDADLDRIHVTAGGSEAVEAAIKIALQYQEAIGEQGRTEIISREPSYHGTTLATAAYSGHLARKRGLARALKENPKARTPYPLRAGAGSNHPSDVGADLESLEQVLKDTGPERVAALLVEPITGSSGGALEAPAGYWHAVARLCREHGILIICDEVMTGFGRTGRDFACQHFDLAPDILVAGKGLAGGYAPLGGVFARTGIGDAIREAGYAVMFHTFGAHPAACAAGAEVLRILRAEALVEASATLGERLKADLQSRFAEHPHVAEVRGRGLLLAIEVVADRADLGCYPESAQMTRRVVQAAFERGVAFYSGGTGAVRDIICLGPAFTSTSAELERMADVLVAAVDAATSAAPT